MPTRPASRSGLGIRRPRPLDNSAPATTTVARPASNHVAPLGMKNAELRGRLATSHQRASRLAVTLARLVRAIDADDPIRIEAAMTVARELIDER